MNKPHYERAPITGRNLQLMMGAYYSDYKDGPMQSYEGIAQRMHLLAAKDAVYGLYTIETIEEMCIKARLQVVIAARTGELSVWTRVDILRAILYNSIKPYGYTVTNKAYSMFIDNLGKLMKANGQPG